MNRNIVVKLGDLRLSNTAIRKSDEPVSMVRPGGNPEPVEPLRAMYDEDTDSLVLAEDAIRAYQAWKSGAVAALVSVVELPAAEEARVRDGYRRTLEAGISSVYDLYCAPCSGA